MRELILRLPPGADLRRALEESCRAEWAEGGFVLSGIGSLQDAALRLAGQERTNVFQGPSEILTLAGSVSSDGAHLHASIALADGTVAGGHVPYGNVVRTTAEVLLARIETRRLAREHDAATGFAELVARAQPPRS